MELLGELPGIPFFRGTFCVTAWESLGQDGGARVRERVFKKRGVVLPCEATYPGRKKGGNRGGSIKGDS